MNNRGVTLVELIVSIVLISIIFLFMFNLLGDVTFEKDNDYLATANEAIRIEAISNLEDAYVNKELESCNCIPEANGGKFHIMGSDRDYNIFKITGKSITVEYYNSSNEQVQKKWSLENGTFGNVTCNSTTVSDGIIYKIVIPVYTTHSENMAGNNNVLDDFIFTVKCKPYNS